jgi:hypothetical protein
MTREQKILWAAQMLLMVAIYRFGYVQGYGNGGHAVINRMIDSAQPWIEQICGVVAV